MRGESNQETGTMAREDFYRDLSRAWGWLHGSSLVSADSARVNASLLTKQLSRIDLWLSPGNTQEYRQCDFEDLPPETRQELDEAVVQFRELASQVAPDQPATDGQYREGRKRFESVVTVVRRIVLKDWALSVEAIVAEAEAWCEKRQWPARRYVTGLRERLLGDYELPRLLFDANGIRIELKPIARFVVGAVGLCDLSVLPSYESLRVIRSMDGWKIRFEAGKTYDTVKVLAWDEAAFAEAVEWVRSRG
jgi:hypothetical protein